MLALAAASGRIGMVFFVGPRLMDWRISNFAARSPRAAATFANKLIVALKPDVVITERATSAAHKGDKTKALVLAMAEAAANHEVLDIAVVREFRYPNKYAEADALTKLYPGLAPWKPKHRRFFDNEPRNTVLFEALALANGMVERSGELAS
ncbi:MAG: hypothetical protein ABL931_21425 [Usitatibacteraceae bacterium]